MQPNARIYVAGSGNFIGAAITRRLREAGYTGVIQEFPGLDLTCDETTEEWFDETAPQYVFLTAGASGGIHANLAQPAELMVNNLRVTTNVMGAAQRHGVRKLLYVASSCCYPRECPQPMHETSLFAGPLEPTNEAYATAKRAGIVLCDAYRKQYGADFFTVVPANPYGPGDDFSDANSHVIAALLRRIHDAKEKREKSVSIWGTGMARREFIHVGDLADACVYLMNRYDGAAGPINVGTGETVSIVELARLIRVLVRFDGELVFDTRKPDGMPQKSLDSARLKAMGWRPGVALAEGLMDTYARCCESGEFRSSVIEECVGY